MFYVRVFCTKFWLQKLQSCVFGLYFFGANILYKKCALKTLMKLTPDLEPTCEPLLLHLKSELEKSPIRDCFIT